MSTTTAAQVAAQATSNPPPGNPPSASQIAAFSAAIRTLESGSPQGNYSYTEKSSTGCRAAYQFCDPTYLNGDPNSTNPVEKGGLAGCGVTSADPSSWDTPAGKACQDAVAQAWFADWYTQGYTFEQIANIWNSGDPNVGYGSQAVALYEKYLGNPDLFAGSTSAVTTSVIGDIPGDIVKGIEDTTAVGLANQAVGGAVGKALSSVGGQVTNQVENWLGDILPANFWVRTAEVVGGVALMIGGVVIFLASTKPGQEAAGATAAVVAA